MSEAPLTDDQVRMLARAGVQRFFDGDALAPFEIDLITIVRDRFLEFGREARVTTREWAVIEGAVTAMEAAASERRTS